MKAKYLLPLSLLVSLFSCSDDDSGTVVPPEPEGTPMKVMSYNIRYSNTTVDFGDNSWDARRQPSIDMILDEAPDVIGLQEPREDQRTDLIEALGSKYEMFCATDDGVEDRYTGHTAIMYRKDRFTLLDKGHFWLSSTPDEVSRPGWNAEDQQYRTTVWVYLHDKEADKDFYFFNTHLPYKNADNEARLNSVRLNVERMKEKAGRHTTVFITGDMNSSWHSSDGRRSCLEPYFEWMWGAREEAVNVNPKVYSYNEFGQTKPGVTWNIDHIFFRNVNPLEFKVINSKKYGVDYISDHYPITLTLTY